jgi:deoxyribodipyrimidine photo-lyase
MECVVLEEYTADGAALSKGCAASPSGFGGLGPDLTRTVAVDGTRPAAAAHRCRRTALPATGKVCRIEDPDPTSLENRATAGLRDVRLWPAVSVSHSLLRTNKGALAEAACRTGVPLLTLGADGQAVLETSTTRAGDDQIVTPRITHGPLQNLPDRAAPAMVERGTPFGEWPRDWHSAIWPYANAGFFNSDQAILQSLEKARTA